MIINAQAAGGQLMRLGLSTGYGMRKHSGLDGKMNEVEEKFEEGMIPQRQSNTRAVSRQGFGTSQIMNNAIMKNQSMSALFKM